jgi:uncharacterized protein (TIGR00369 family)
MTDKPFTVPQEAAPAGAEPTRASPRVGKSSGFRTLVGYEAIEWRAGLARMRVDLRQAHMNSNGVAHGGVIMTIIDASMGHAATFCDVPGHRRYTSTISLTTSFLESPREGSIITATGRLVSIDNRVATCEAEARDADGRLIAVAQGSFRYATGSERPEGVPQRAKR